MTSIIILPGIGGSGEAHWQTLWEEQDPRMQRFRPTNWDEPDLTDWISALERSVAAAPAPPVLVAHSLACLLVAHWQQASALPVAGAFLVAVPDPQAAAFPNEAKGFANPPTEALRFPPSSSPAPTTPTAPSTTPASAPANGKAASLKSARAATSMAKADWVTGRRV